MTASKKPHLSKDAESPEFDGAPRRTGIPPILLSLVAFEDLPDDNTVAVARMS